MDFDETIPSELRDLLQELSEENSEKITECYKDLTLQLEYLRVNFEETKHSLTAIKILLFAIILVLIVR